MQIAGPPSLGFWEELLQSVATVGTQVYKTKTETKTATENLKLQIAAQAQANANQLKLQSLQTQAAQAVAVASQNGAPVASLPPGLLPVPGAPGLYTLAPAPRSAPWPAWAVPAAIGGGVLVLVLLLSRR